MRRKALTQEERDQEVYEAAKMLNGAMSGCGIAFMILLLLWAGLWVLYSLGVRL